MSPFEGLFNRGDAQSRVASLIEKLGNTDEKTVNNAMKDLAKHMPLATGRLLQAINDHTAEVEWKESQKAIDALDSNTQRAVKTLISDLASGDKKKYDMALNALMQTGNQQMAMSILNLATFEMKAKSSFQRRRKALELLSQASTIEQDKSITISALVSALGDGYPARDLTKKLLSRYGNEVTPHLLVALQRGYVDLRRQASEELMEKPPDLPQHIAVLTGYIYDSDNVVALNVIKALYKVGSLPKEAIQTLFRIYNQDKNYSDRSAINRHHEADDLIMKLGPNNIEVFAEALRHPGTKNYTQSVDFIYRISEQDPQAVKKIARPYLYDTLLKQEGGNKTDIAHIIQHIGASIDDLPDLLSTF